MTRVVAFVPDLMDRSKLAAAGDVTFVSAPGDLADAVDGADLVIVDLSRPGVLEILRGLPPERSARLVGFGSHVDRELLEEAQRSGCDEVLARSSFWRRLETILGPGE